MLKVSIKIAAAPFFATFSVLTSSGEDEIFCASGVRSGCDRILH